MNISLQWLEDYLDWDGTTDELVAVLTRAGLSVERVETRGSDLLKVVIAQILESNQHPNADRLSVCRVDDGSGTPRQIVCGAKNYKVGDKIPLALPGAMLPGDFRIKTGKLRGVESEGMMCSGKELGMSADSEGLLILSPDAKVGDPVSSLFPAGTMLELEITPNRPDWLGHIGVAREIAAFTKKPLRFESFALPATRTDESVVTIDSDACSFYSARIIRGVKVGPSPAWLRQRLESVGLRPINNIVDITNYVMMETGHPLHAFDLAKVDEGIVVRSAKEGEKLQALDGREYALKTDHLVIADKSKVLALAGVMGGEQSGVTETTTDILLESAVFDPPTIRRASHGLGLYSDSSYRFERGTSLPGAFQASGRAVQLILEIAEGSPIIPLVIAGSEDPDRNVIALRYNRCRNLLGLDFSNEEIDSLISRFGVEKLTGDVEASQWLAPWHRLDLLREADLIEEVARLYGIENLSGRVIAQPAATTPSDHIYDFAMQLRQRLTAMGFYEARTSALVSENLVRQSYEGDLLRVKNPLGEEQAILRPSLVPELLGVAARNIRNGSDTIRFFEIGRVFRPATSEESLRVSLIMTGETSATTWRNEKARQIDLFDLKGCIENLSRAKVSFQEKQISGYVLALEILLNGKPAGFLAQLPPAKSKTLDARGAIVVAELEFDALIFAEDRKLFTKEIPKFPAVSRDIACMMKASTPYSDLRKILDEAHEPLLVDVQLFDVFRDPSGERLSADQKSLAFSLTFRSNERTLTSEEINAACDRLKGQLKKSLGVDFRE